MVTGEINPQRGVGGLSMSVEPINSIRTHSRLTAYPRLQSNGMLYLSGHAAISESGELIGVGDFDAQAQATFESLQRTLQPAAPICLK